MHWGKRACVVLVCLRYVVATLSRKERQVDLPADYMQGCPSGLAWWQSLSDSAYQMYLIPAFSIQSFIANEFLRTQRKYEMPKIVCIQIMFSFGFSWFLKSPINRNANRCVMYLSESFNCWKHDNLFSHCSQQGWITPVEMTHLCLTSPWSCAYCIHKEKDCLCCLKQHTQSG